MLNTATRLQRALTLAEIGMQKDDVAEPLNQAVSVVKAMCGVVISVLLRVTVAVNGAIITIP